MEVNSWCMSRPTWLTYFVPSGAHLAASQQLSLSAVSPPISTGNPEEQQCLLLVETSWTAGGGLLDNRCSLRQVFAPN